MRSAHRVPCIAVLAALVLAACSVDRAGLRVSDPVPGVDGGGLDFGMIDLGTLDLAVRDLGVSDPDLGPEALDFGPELLDIGPPDMGAPDMGPPDLGQPDLGPPDLGPPDLGPPDLGPGRPSCDSLYGSAGSYQLCGERAMECEFYTVLNSASCDDRCTALGGTCIAVHNNGWSRCDRGGDFACDGDYYDAICICSR